MISMPEREVIDEFISVALSYGLVMRRMHNNGEVEVTCPPVTLTPTKISRHAFEKLKQLMPLWNALIDRIARDFSFLQESLTETARSDVEFTTPLLRILADVYAAPGAKYQPLMLGVFRSDYFHSQTPAPGRSTPWSHVEINTISVSFAGLSTRVGQFHQYLRSRSKQIGRDAVRGEIEVSESEVEVPKALQAAVRCWETREGVTIGSGVIVVVTQEGERNTGDQFILSSRLGEVPFYRTTLRRLQEKMTLGPCSAACGAPHARLGGESGPLVALFYFRSCYTAADLPDESYWQVRKDIERSSAVKCPSVPYHLCTYKKIQQLLTNRAVFDRFVDSHSGPELFDTFVPQHTLDVGKKNQAERNEENERVWAAVAEAIAHPNDFVLKSQQEGAGKIIVKEELRQCLLRISKSEEEEEEEGEDGIHANRLRKEFILMDRIPFDVSDGEILRFGEIISLPGNCCGEVGTFGTILSDGSERGGVLENRYAGYVVRSKPATTEGGGVMAGNAALDSVALV